MLYKYKNITTVAAPALIAHGVNAQNVMGSGVAKAIYMKWPEVKAQYHKHGSMELGDAQFVDVCEGIVVANCFTQQEYGRSGEKYASVAAIKSALWKVGDYVTFAMEDINEIHLPKIGSGLGGLSREDEVRPVLLELEEIWEDLQFVVCEI